MDIFSVITLCGGLAFFLFGMSTMSSSLEKLAGGRLEQLLKRMTDNRFKSLLLGAGITIAIQSSSAMTVMLVGLVNSGIMELGQTVGVIMGSNVGTTLTAWILSLSGIEGDNVWLKLLKPEVFSPVAALAGIIMTMSAKKSRTKGAGTILVGFAVLMTGMEMMKDAMSPLAEMPEFASILTAFTNPFLGVVVGAVFTGVIQSSAASVGILQALSITGGITYGMALPIIMGQNIGTCVTALLSSIGVNRNARRVSASISPSTSSVRRCAWRRSTAATSSSIMPLWTCPSGRRGSPWSTASSTSLPPCCCCPLPSIWRSWPTWWSGRTRGEGEICLYRRAPAGDALGGHRGVRQQDRGHGAAGGDYDPAGPHPSGKIR